MKACDLQCGRYAHHRDEDKPWVCKACTQLAGLESSIAKRNPRYLNAMLDAATARGIGVVVAKTVRYHQPSRSYRQATQHDREIRYAHLPVRANGGDHEYHNPPIPRAPYGSYPERIREAAPKTTRVSRDSSMGAPAPMTYADRLAKYGAIGDANH